MNKKKYKKYSKFKFVVPQLCKLQKYSNASLFRSSNFNFYKHFLFLSYIVFTKKKCLKSCFYFIYLLNYKYLKLANTDKKIQLILNNLKKNTYITKVAIKSFFNTNLTIYSLNKLSKQWKIIEYFFLPKKMWLNYIFLGKIIKLINLPSLLENILQKVKYSYFVVNFILNNFFSIKVNWSNFFYVDYLLLISNQHKKNPINLNFNLNFFLINNKSFWFNFHKFIRTIPDGYTSYWAFLNVSLFLTWSFLKQYNVPVSSLDFWLFKDINKIFFWSGDFDKRLRIEHYFVWNWWNFFYWLGIPYKKIYYENYTNLLFYNTMFSLNIRNPKYYYFSMLNLKTFQLFNNYMCNNYKIINIKKYKKKEK